MIYAFAGKYPQVEEGAFVAPGATLIGEVNIARQASVWYGAVLRGDLAPIRVAAGSNIQDNAVLHTDVGYPVWIGEDVTVGHNATVHGCTVDPLALIGMGATLLNGCHVGRGAVVAAQSLVPEGRKVEPGQLVRGVPARPGGKVSEQHAEGIKANSELYKALALQHQDSLSLLARQAYKLVVFVPRQDLDQLKEALFAAGAGQLGLYRRCSWQVAGQGNFQPQPGSHPAMGQQGRDSQVDEDRLEMLVPAATLPSVLRALVEHHPYETPAFDLWPVHTG